MMGICEKCGEYTEVILCVYRGEANNVIYMCHACVEKEIPKCSHNSIHPDLVEKVVKEALDG